MIGVDTETTGTDLWHGARPFMVSLSYPSGKIITWEWNVNPITRKPKYLVNDWKEIAKHINGKKLIFQNGKFDIQAMTLADNYGYIKWNYDLIHDTLLDSHIIASSAAHDLTSLSLEWLGVDIYPLEQAVQKACIAARGIIKRKFPTWRTAREGEPDIPSAKGEKQWKFDMWAPLAVAQALDYPQKHPWWTVVREYNKADVAVLIPLHEKQQEVLKERGHLKASKFRRKLIPVVTSMESVGVTYDTKRQSELYDEYSKAADIAEAACIKLSDGNLEKLPKGGGSNQLTSTLFDHFGLTSNKFSKKTGNAKADKDVLAYWMETLPLDSKAYKFIDNLRKCRQRRTACGYMEGYKRAGIPCGVGDTWRRLHPSLNITGTNTLRGSSSNPNEQNISKKEGFNLRYLFGPMPGREWWSLDYENIELRLPAYEAGETEMINLFERPNDPPYFGSNHLLVAHVLHPKEFEWCLEHDVSFKDKYKGTLYQRTKNGNFAVQYGAIEQSGTADRAYGVPGAQTLIKRRFKKISRLNDQCIAFAQEHGFIYTMEDREYGRYPLECEFSKWGKVKPTVPLNYHIQSTAMWGMCRAMVRVHNYLRSLDIGCFIVMQVHDELVLDFPQGRGPEPWRTNLAIIRTVKKLMEMSGNDVGVPLKASVAYHPVSYDKGLEIAL